MTERELDAIADSLIWIGHRSSRDPFGESEVDPLVIASLRDELWKVLEVLGDTRVRGDMQEREKFRIDIDGWVKQQTSLPDDVLQVLGATARLRDALSWPVPVTVSHKHDFTSHGYTVSLDIEGDGDGQSAAAEALVEALVALGAKTAEC